MVARVIDRFIAVNGIIEKLAITSLPIRNRIARITYTAEKLFQHHALRETERERVMAKSAKTVPSKASATIHKCEYFANDDSRIHEKLTT